MGAKDYARAPTFSPPIPIPPLPQPAGPVNGERGPIHKQHGARAGRSNPRWLRAQEKTFASKYHAAQGAGRATVTTSRCHTPPKIALLVALTPSVKCVSKPICLFAPTEGRDVPRNLYSSKKFKVLSLRLSIQIPRRLLHGCAVRGARSIAR